MLSRRDLIASSAFLSQARGTPPAEAAQQRGPRSSSELQALDEIRDAVRDLRTPVRTPGGGVISQIRDRQRTFFRQYQRFPELIDIGVRVWESMIDWHVEYQRELKITRNADGRYYMEFMFTQLVLRYELADIEVGIAYDR